MFRLAVDLKRGIQMAVETKVTLSDEVVSKIQGLVRINIDSESGFNEAAQNVDDTAMASLFSELGAQRAQNATILQDYVAWNGETPADEGTYAAAFHRVWLNVRSKFSGGDAHAVLCEAERGEDCIKEAYEDVLKQTAGSAMNDVLTRQYANVKAGHDRIRDLRDSFAKKQ
jgi:uncharacterized protein (TIGR02284 family)